MKHLFILLCFGVYGVNLIAQDFSYSQFWANKIALNPAYAIAAPGTNLYVIGRYQWPNIPDHSLNFYNANISLSTEIADRFHGGLDINTTGEGEGYLRNFHFGMIGGYFLKPISFGFKGSYNIQTIDWDKFVFSDQIDPVLGQISNTSQAIPPIVEKKSYLDMDIGALYEQPVGKKSFLEIGVNVKHLLMPETSIQNIQTNLPMRLVVHSTGSFLLNSSVSNQSFVFLSPSVQINLQDIIRTKLSSFSVGTNLIYVPKNKVGKEKAVYTSIFGGFYWHNRYSLPYGGVNTTAYTALFGYKIQKNWGFTEFVASYDFNAGRLNQANTNGVLELSILCGFNTVRL